MLHYFEESLALKNALVEDKQFHASVERAIAMLSACFKRGNKMLIAGNGGSAADAQHFAGEIVSGYKNLSRKGYPAIALTTDSSIMTAWSNDREHGFHTLFARKLQALGNKGDVFLAISTSGNSKNLIEAAKVAKEHGIETLAFLGKGGGELKNHVDHSIIVPSDNVPRIQEIHIFLTHTICEELEKTTLV